MIKKVNVVTSEVRRRARVRGKLRISSLPRVTVFRSTRYFYGQLIDDQKASTLAAVGSKDGTDAKQLGMLLAKKALEKKIKKAKFDRGSYRYHGKVKDFAEGLREGGLQL